MTIDEILPLDYQPATDTRRLAQQQDAEREQRNRGNLVDWHVKTFGPIAGVILGREAP